MSKKSLLIASGVVIVVFCGSLLLWNYLSQDSPSLRPQRIAAPAAKTGTQTNDTGMNILNDTVLGVTLTYPRNWVTLRCDQREKTLYMASDDRGLGRGEGESVLCGAGTDFPPQIYVGLLPAGSRYEGNAPAETLTISGKSAKKYVDVSNGDELREAGFKTTTYYIEIESGVLIAVYNRWPEGLGDYDTSQESENSFIQMVESFQFN